MPTYDRAAIREVTQIGPEVTPGVAVPATKRLNSLKLVITDKAEVDTFKGSGSKLVNVATLNTESAEVKVDGKPVFDELLYLFVGAVCAPITTPHGAKTFTHVFRPKTYGEDVLKTFTIESGSDLLAERYVNAFFKSLGLDFSRKEIKLDASMMAGAAEDNIIMTGPETQTVTITGNPTGGTFTLTFSGQTTTGIPFNAAASAVQTALAALSTIGAGNVFVRGGPGPATAYSVAFVGDLADDNVASMTASGASLTGGATPSVAVTAGQVPTLIDLLPLVPIMPGKVDVFIADSYAGLAGATKLDRGFQVGWNVADRQEEFWTLNSSLTSYAGRVEGDPKYQGKLTLMANQQGLALRQKMRKGTTLFMRILATGDDIEAGYPYMLQIDVAWKVTGTGGKKDDESLVKVEWSFDETHDTDLGGGCVITLQNTLASV